jgi:hypothetical protein
MEGVVSQQKEGKRTSGASNNLALPKERKSRPISTLLTKAASLPTLLLPHPTLPAIPPKSGNPQFDEGSQLQEK